MTNLIVWAIAGAVLGWLASLITRSRGLGNLITNIGMGIVGAVLAGYLVTPMFNISTFNQGSFSIPALLLSLGGAVILLGVLNLFRSKRNVTDNVLETKWARVRSKIHVRWAKLTEEDIEQISGKHDTFINLLRERYGLNEEKAEDELQSYLRAVV
jgi:uncharacterized membrane protein YeaQ/YmgE (transglycosylase-associated protein family)